MLNIVLFIRILMNYFLTNHVLRIITKVTFFFGILPFAEELEGQPPCETQCHHLGIQHLLDKN